MKTKKRLLAMLIALAISIGIFTGCSDPDDDTYDAAECVADIVSADKAAESVETEDVIGKITYVDESCFSMTVYDVPSEITDYASLDITALTEVSNVDYVYTLEKSACYQIISGVMETASADDLAVGSLVSVSTDADGLQQILILNTAEATSIAVAAEEAIAVAETTQPVALNDSQILSLIESTAEKYGATGIQVAIVDAGEIVGSYAYGWATVGTEPMTIDHKIRIASISKVMIGVVAMLLQEDGIIDLDEDIGNYWDITARNPMYPEIPITVRSLLTHTSSIRCYSDDYSTDHSSVRNRLSSGYSNLVPGDISSRVYNNYAFRVLGMTLELAADKTADEILEEKLFAAMDIDAAFASGDIQDTDKLVTLYRQDGSVVRTVAAQKSLHSADVPGANGTYFAGGLTISAADLAKVVAMLAGDGTYAGTQYLTEESVQLMETYLSEPLSNGAYQALPLFYAPELFGRESIYFHPGIAYGVYSCISYDSETGDGVVVLTTGADGTADQYDIAFVCSEISQHIYSMIE